jgi:hypothetical protein
MHGSKTGSQGDSWQQIYETEAAFPANADERKVITLDDYFQKKDHIDSWLPRVVRAVLVDPSDGDE